MAPYGITDLPQVNTGLSRLAVAATIFTSWRVDRRTTALLIRYLAWIAWLSPIMSGAASRAVAWGGLESDDRELDRAGGGPPRQFGPEVCVLGDMPALDTQLSAGGSPMQAECTEFLTAVALLADALPRE